MKKVFSIIAISTLMLAGACSTAKVKNTGTVRTVKSKISENTGYYLESGVVIASFSMEGGGYSEMGFYPARLLQEADETTKGEYKVQSLMSSSDVAEGQIHWTKYVVFKSHPAKKEDMKKGMVVLAVFDPSPRDRGDLKRAIWNRVFVLDTDELYKGKVKLGFVWNPGRSGESDRVEEVPLCNIRVIDSASFSTEAK